jgi:N-acetylneuraminic acid mutarotase
MTARLILMTKRLFLSLTLVSSLHAADWEQLPPLPEPNGGFVCGHEKGKIIVIGGTNWEGGTKNWLKVARFFDPAMRVWRSSHNMMNAVAYACVFQSDEGLAFVGGFAGDGPSSWFGWAKEPRPVLYFDGHLPGNLVLASAGVVEGELIVVGGMSDPAVLDSVTSRTLKLQWGRNGGRWSIVDHPQGDLALQNNFTVKHLAAFPGKPFATAASAVLGDELFVLGGMNYDAAAKLPVNSDEAYAFSPSKNAWRALKPLVKAKRGLTAVTLDEKHIYIAGGYADDFTSEAVIYDVTTDSYRAAKSLPYAAMVGLVKLGDYVYCLGGEDKMKHRTDKFFRIAVAELLK